MASEPSPFGVCVHQTFNGFSCCESCWDKATKALQALHAANITPEQVGPIVGHARNAVCEIPQIESGITITSKPGRNTADDLKLLRYALSPESEADNESRPL